MGTKLLDVSPKDLKFTFELKKQSFCSVRLTNLTDNDVAFKVKTTSPNKYCVRPNVGVVPPHTTTKFTITMQAPKVAPPELICKDKFLVQSTVVSPGTKEQAITTTIFSKSSGNYVEEVKLRVTMISPPLSPLAESEDNVCTEDEPFAYDKPNGVSHLDNVDSFRQPNVVDEVDDVYLRSRKNSIEFADVDIRTLNMPVEVVDVDTKARNMPVEVADVDFKARNMPIADVDTKTRNTPIADVDIKALNRLIEDSVVDFKARKRPIADVDTKTRNTPIADVDIKALNRHIEEADVDIKARNRPIADVDIKTLNMPNTQVDVRTQNRHIEEADVDIKAWNRPIEMADVDVKDRNGPIAETDIDIKARNRPIEIADVDIKTRNRPIEMADMNFKPGKHSIESDDVDMMTRMVESADFDRKSWMLESAEVDKKPWMLESADVDIEEGEIVQKLKAQLNSVESKLDKAERAIGKLSEETRMSIKEGKLLREELEMLKRTHRMKRQTGFPLLFVVMVAMMTTILGYLSHHQR